MHKGTRGLPIAALVLTVFLAFGLGAYATGLLDILYSGQNSITMSGVNPCEALNNDFELSQCSEWRSANAAEKSANWAVYGFWATIGGMILLSWQIMLTRRAVEDTRDATNAMRESNDILRIVEDARITATITQTRFYKEAGLFFDFEFGNIGRSPGIIHSVSIEYDEVNIEQEIVPGDKVKFEELSFTHWLSDPPCHVCHNGEGPDPFLVIVEQTTPLRGRFTVEIPCTYTLTEHGWQGIMQFQDRVEILGGAK